MSIEKRLQDHMAEQARHIDIESTDPALLTARSADSPFRTVSVLAAALVVLLAGAGFWALSQDETPVTEIAAGEADEADEDQGPDDGDQENSEAAPASFITLERTDVSSSNTPSMGRVKVDNGVYYLLSTAPGKVDINYDEDRPEEEWAELFRPRTFYVLGSDNQWQANDVGDRFVSDFEVDDGVIYAISTGTVSGDTTASYGTSTDQGRSWDWKPLDGLPTATQLTLLVNDGQSVIYAGRWGNVNWEQAIDLANGAGLVLDELNIWDLNDHSITYIPVDPADRCLILSQRFLPEIASFLEYAEESGDRALEEEFPDMINYFKDEFRREGCDWNEEWETGQGIEDVNLPDPVTVTWDKLGVTIPEEWKSWESVYTYDGNQLTDVGTPFGDDIQVGYSEARDGALRVSTYAPNLGEEEIHSETFWITSNGIDWEQQVVRFDNHDEQSSLYYDNVSFREPRAGQDLYRIWWDEEAFFELEQETMRLLEAGELTEQEVEERMVGQQPAPLLQRRSPGAEWETVDMAALAPDVDLGDRMLADVRGTSLGVFLVFAENHSFDGPPESGLTIVHSSNGQDWDSFEVKGNGVTTYSAEDSVLLIANEYVIREGQDTSETQAVLIRAAG